MIKILRDICISHPDFPKATEICVKIIRRISDEEGIKVIQDWSLETSQSFFSPFLADCAPEGMITPMRFCSYRHTF